MDLWGNVKVPDSYGVARMGVSEEFLSWHDGDYRQLERLACIMRIGYRGSERSPALLVLTVGTVGNSMFL